ncbi:Subunit of heteropentameric Replication factor C (RF-C) [Mycoemilia scoparia]|uniref:Replication factor C subunit 3 n=1 Tax=Mycoemilia scoparia TaxID=417184 RepID=A0A9W8DSN3_9FUNG|nr:Subunit of heteropentameric Replication factor C (RF-C) [Mycoemilia scoparia]
MTAMDIDDNPPQPFSTTTTTTTRPNKGKAKDDTTTVPKLNENLPWVEKYRPNTLDDLVSQQGIVDTIEKFIAENRLPHLLFYGPPGTGKTSTILALAKKLYGPKAYKNMILELNASDDRGIDVVRDQIKSFASTRTVSMLSSSASGGNNISDFKLVVLDEADAMTQAAQAALRRVIEKYTRNVRFCIICNYVSKITPAIQSRCTKFRFSPLKIEQVQERLQMVVDTEGVNITKDGKGALLRLSKGDMRRVLNVLQACHAAYPGGIDENEIYACTGSPHPKDIQRIGESMVKDDFSTALDQICMLKTDRGLALQDVITELLGYIEGIEFPNATRIYLLDKLADIELANGASETIQLSSLIGAFKVGIELAAK